MKACDASAFRKLIAETASPVEEKRCSSREYTACPAYRQQPLACPVPDRCPYLHVSLMQYCSATPVTRFVPYSGLPLSRCGNSRYRYCEFYLGSATAHEPALQIAGMPFPAHLKYSANHMWLEQSPDGWWHIGVDAFLARAIGTVEKISFVTTRGLEYPTAILAAGTMEFQIVFPSAVRIAGFNIRLRADARRLTAAPYSLGWLFEGTGPVRLPEISYGGTRISAWIEQEAAALSGCLRARDSRMADGGLFSAGFLHALAREEGLRLFHDFFSPHRGGREHDERQIVLPGGPGDGAGSGLGRLPESTVPGDPAAHAVQPPHPYGRKGRNAV